MRPPRDDTILAVYGVRADVLHALGHAEDPPPRMSEAAVLTTGWVAMLFLRGHVAAARALLGLPQYLPHLLSRRRVNRRLQRLTDLFLILFDLLGYTWKPLNTELVYVIESFPVVVCDNYRLPRAKFYQHEAYRGCLARKQR
jgi:hypothetical protein